MSHLSRRSLLRSALAGGAALGLGPVLAACGDDAGKTESGDTKLVFLEPGDEPVRWNEVRTAVNAKLSKDTGLSFDVQWIGWSKYAESELLKYTSGEKFTGSLEANWLHHAKLASDKAIFSLDEEFTVTKYPNLRKTLDPVTIKTSKIAGKLWGVPQVNNAGFVLGFVIRKDLTGGEVSTFDDLERFLYNVKQKQPTMTPYGCDNGYVNNTQELFNAEFWNGRPEYLQVDLDSRYPLVFVKTADAIAGNARLVPVWEVPAVMSTFRRIRKYQADGILNSDVLNVDKKTALSLFGSGKYAAGIGVTDGLQTGAYGATLKNVPGSAIELVMPFASGAPKPFSVFGASNHMAFNARGDQMAEGLKFLDWLSIKENHDLLQYGVEGTDWKAVGSDQFEQLGRYVFPGYTMSWRVPLERTPSNMIESERKWFGWSQRFDSFESSPLAGFTVDNTAIKSELAQISAGKARFLKPLQAGVIDTDKGIEEVKKGFAAAGLEKVMAEAEKQLSAFFKAR